MAISKSPADARYNKRVLGLSLAYGLALLPVTYVFKHGLVSGPTAVAVAILPAIPIVLIFVAIGRYLVEERDEYLRMLMTRQVLWASAFALTVATIQGFLEAYRVTQPMPPYDVVMVWFFGLGVGAVANRLTLGKGV
jgi:heme/copper-type cytochrome/quinol oxidase subunit 4